MLSSDLVKWGRIWAMPPVPNRCNGALVRTQNRGFVFDMNQTALLTLLELDLCQMSSFDAPEAVSDIELEMGQRRSADFNCAAMD